MRKILLTLADDTTSIRCGRCHQLTRDGHGNKCRAFLMFTDGERLPECLAAERDAGELVAITRDDAAALVRDVPAFPIKFPIAHKEWKRIENALRAHAKGE